MYLSDALISLPPAPPPSTQAAYVAPHVAATVGHADHANPRHRDQMEDAVAVHIPENLPGVFVAVYDGHGGRRASTLLKELLHRVFLDELLGEARSLEPRRPPPCTPVAHSLERNHPPVAALQPPSAPHARVCVQRSLHAAAPAVVDDDVISDCSTPAFDDEDIDRDIDDDHYDDDNDNDMSDAAASSHTRSQNLHPTRRARGVGRRASVSPPPLPPSSAAKAQAAFPRAFAKMDAILKVRNCAREGATAVTAFVHRTPTDRVLTVANCGDSRAVLSRAGRPARLSIDHKVTEPAERDRILSHGGFVLCGRVNGTLNVARAFGDHCMKSVIVSTPCVVQVVLSALDEFLILACDGLWDVVDDRDAVRIAQEAFDRALSPKDVAAVLVEEALRRGSTDNVSVVIVQLVMD